MSSRQLPLLCHNVNVYQGPYVPVSGLKGHVRAEGLAEQDVLQVYGLTYGKEFMHLGTLDTAMLAVIFDPKRFEYIRANRVYSSGKPITVWVA